MVTGANSGVGFEVAKFLAGKGASVVMVCRSAKRAEEAASAIREATKSDKVRAEALRARGGGAFLRVRVGR